MAFDDDGQQNPFTRPGFIGAAVVVAVIVTLGIIIAIVNATREDPNPQPSSSAAAPVTSAVPTAEPSAVAGDASVCGLDGEELTGSLATAPDAQWAYQGTTAYPTSTTYGPGETNDAGVRYCFQRSPSGAVMAAANAVTQGTDPATVGEWLAYFVANTPAGDALLASDSENDAETAGTRVQIAGFRLLSYTGTTARVDVAVRGTSEGQTVNMSMVYQLVWEAGDWKLHVDDPALPIDVAMIPDFVGYITWGSE